MSYEWGHIETLRVKHRYEATYTLSSPDNAIDHS